ncbi:MAG: radical SAM protein, partial [Elusimicrobiales bacterium]|nr:radical SAM protein [Elusimicrobiales bacterium]
MVARISGIVIVPGYACNFFCKHCIASGRKKRALSKIEIEKVTEAICRHKIKSISFTGGEPTLYVPLVNKILAGISGKAALDVTITTNGWFAAEQSKAEKILASLPRLKNVQLSYDRHHKEFLHKDCVSNLYKACKSLKKRFSVVLTVSSPLDLPLIAELRKIGRFTIGVQKAMPFGAALKNKTYYKHAAFDNMVLSQKCPVRGKVAYLPGYGFSACCVATELETKKIRYFYPTLEELIGSRFYELVNKFSFKQIA